MIVLVKHSFSQIVVKQLFMTFERLSGVIIHYITQLFSNNVK
jgi:hypothetical protein